MRRSWSRAAVAAVAVGALVAVGTVTQAEASPLEVARRAGAATLAEVRAAAVVHESRIAAQTKAPEPVATGTVKPDTSSTVKADEVGVTATFSGNEVPSELQVSVGEAPKDAAVSAQAEQPGGGVPVSDPVQITAKDSAGTQRTQFPAKRTHTRGGGKSGPVVSDILPGVALTLAPDLDRVKSSGVDPKSLKIYTREIPGDTWTALPSYYDAKAGVVKGVSTHLSQFVVIGVKFVPPPGPVIVLDPDNDEGHVTTPAPPVSELGFNIRLAQLVKAALETDCRASVQITREDPADPFVPREIRAGQMAAANPVLSLGIGFNTLNGTAWGTAAEGGSQIYSRGGAEDDAVSNSLVGVLPTYTGRPAKNMGNNGNFPGNEFSGVPGAFTHLEALFMDHNYDRVMIDQNFQGIANGVLTGLGVWLEAHGFDCTDPVTGGWPAPPSKADFERWRNLGHQNYLTYGGDPVSFSTGNLVEDEHLFTLPGAGGSSTDVTLTYNSQDGRLSRVGAGWSFGLGARAQRFDDGSVLVVRGDGASYVFTGNGAGGYTAEPSVHQVLAEQPGGRLQLRDVSGETWVYDAGDIEGIGELVSHTDMNGNTTTLSYGPADGSVQQFVPLTQITAPSGQVIQVQSDAAGRVTGFTRPGGDRWALAYDGSGNLTTITLPDGRTHTFTYDNAHQLLTATDATAAVYLRNEYDGSGRVAKQWDAAGKLRVFDYSKPGQTSYTDNLGRVSVFAFDAQHRITKVTHPDSTTASFTFDGADNVTSSTDENGAVTKNVYDGSGNLAEQSLPTGAVVKYTYTPTGLVATKTDTGGAKGAARTWAYDYDTGGRLTVTHQPDGTTTTNRYDNAGNVVASVQPSGATTTYGYDAAGHLTSSTDPTGAVTRLGYDAAGRVVSRTDPNGNTTTYAWDSGDRMTAATDAAGGVTRYGWEPNDHVAAVTDPTRATSTYTWDALFHLTSSTNPLGGVTKNSYDGEDALTQQTDPLGAITQYVTDGRNRVTQVTDPNGGVWKREYDKVGNLTSVTSPTDGVTSYRYDAVGNLTSQVDATGGKTTYRYDNVGRLVGRIDADGVTQKYGYDLLDRVTTVIDGLGKKTRYAYDVDGNLTSLTGRDGQITAYTYDPAGRVTAVTRPLGDVTTYGYDPAGNRTTVTDPLGRTSTLTYTPLNQVATITDSAGNTTAHTYDGNGRPVTVTDANGNTTASTYTPNGDQATVTDPTGAVTAYGWDKAGQQTSITDPNGNTTIYGYDPDGLLTRVTEGYQKGAAPTADVNVVTKYGHDKAGNLTQLIDPNGHTTSYTVDAAGRTTSEVNPVGNTTRTTFTKAGRLASTTTGTGAVVANTYDMRGDLIRQNTGGSNASFEYDPEQRLIAVTDPTGVSGFVYDKNGQVTTQINQQGGRLSTTYDKAGQTTGLTLPTGHNLAYTYDQAGRPTSQTSPWGSLTYVWDAAGRLTEQGRSTGVVTAHRYDPANRVTAVTHTTPQIATVPTPSPTPTAVPYAAGDEQATKCTSVAAYLAGRTPPAAGESKLCKHANTYLNDRDLPIPENPVPDGGALAYTYEYDKAGNTTTQARSITGKPATATSYRYDHLNRLTASTTNAGEKNTYTYDPAGNRTGRQRAGAKDGNFTQTATFTDANQVTHTSTTGTGRGVAAGDATYSYDGAGNRVGQNIAGVSTQYGYNPSGQTTSVTRDGRTTAYGYDSLGRRTTTTDTTKYGTDTTRTVYNGNSAAQEADQAHGTTTLIRDAVGRLAEHVTASGDAKWDLLDRLGSTVAGAAGGSILNLSSYDDWGAQSFESNGWSASESYTGELSDPTEGLNHYGARSYDPRAGSWTAPDPWRGVAAQPQSVHRYAFTENNPTTFIDVGGYRIGDPSAYNTKNPIQAYAMRQVDNATNYEVALSRTRAAGVAPPPKPKVKNPTWENDSAWRHALYESYWPAGVNCDQQVKVGMSQQQLAINKACGEALSKASLSTQPQWVQDLYNANKAFADAATPLVVIGIAGAAGSGAAGASGKAIAGAGEAVKTAGELLPGVKAGWPSRVADNGKGTIWQAPGSTGNANMLRVMGPTEEYTNGYVRFYNEHGQPIGLNGKPGPRPDTHIPRNPDGSYELPEGW